MPSDATNGLGGHEPSSDALAPPIATRLILFDTDAHVLKTGRRAFVELRRYGKLGESIRRLRYDSLRLAETLDLSEYVWEKLLDRAAAKGVRLPPLPRDARATL